MKYVNFITFLVLFIPGLVAVPALSQEIKQENLEFEKIIENMNFPEGPAFDGKGNLYVSSCYGGFIMKISENEKKVFLDSTMGDIPINHTNGLTIYKDGSIIACDYGRGAILKIKADGKVSILSDGFEGKRYNRPNDLALDKYGNIYFSDPKSYDKNKPDGRVFRIDSKTGKVKMVCDSIYYPNGLAFSEDSKYLFLSESAKRRILKFRVNKDGTLSDKKEFVGVPSGDPDGIALDKKGNLYVAHFGGGNILIVSPQGKIIVKIPAPGKKPSNIEFAGKDLKTLYLTEDETNCVYRTKVKIPGIPLQASPLRKR